MPQETTTEFSVRLDQALEGAPTAPPSRHGRITWLKRELQKSGVDVSVNTVHKWVRGQSRPREDNIRAIARALSVDELWLAMGRKPVPEVEQLSDAATASGAWLVVAGLIELKGGKVIFPGSKTGHRMVVSFNGVQFDLVAVAPKEDGDTLSFLVPEPTENARIVGVILPDEHSIAVQLVDLTSVPRQSLGGFSVVQIRRQTDGGYETQDLQFPVVSLGSVEELATA